MVDRLRRGLTRTSRGLVVAVAARPTVFWLAAAGVIAVNLLLPPLVLSVARKPWDYFTVNPWLPKLPAYLVSADVPLQQKARFLPNLALFWLSADSPYGVEWGFAVTAGDLVRFVLMSLIFGAYFSLWAYGRERLGRRGPGAQTARHGGLAATLAGVVGFSTGPCSVMGCGAPVMPVIGLAFAGLSSGSIRLLAETSRVATALVFLAMTLGVAYLGWRVGATAGDESNESRDSSQRKAQGPSPFG